MAANGNNIKGEGFFFDKITTTFPANKPKLILRSTTQCLLKISQTLNPDNIDTALGSSIAFSNNGTGSIVPDFGFPSTGTYTVNYRIQQSLFYLNYYGWAHVEDGLLVPDPGFSFFTAMASLKNVSVGKSNVKFSRQVQKQTVVSAGTERPPGGQPSPISIGTIQAVSPNYSTFANTLDWDSQNPDSVTYGINSGANTEMLIVINYLETLSA